jgi:hypothetical protein
MNAFTGHGELPELKTETLRAVGAAFALRTNSAAVRCPQIYGRQFVSCLRTQRERKLTWGIDPLESREVAMFRKLIDDYRKQAAEQISDAEELESGRWRIWNQDGDQSGSTASSKRSLAARLLGFSKAYEDLDE